MELSGPIGERFDAGVTNWLIPAPYANPGMLQMYFRRNLPHQEIMEWYGEFAGKWLTGAALCYAMKPDEDLRRAADYVTETLCKAQDKDGYLGVWPDDTKYLEARHRSGRFAWESEILVLAARSGETIASVPIPVLYAEGGPSHISHVRDTLRFLALWLRLALKR